MQNYTVKRGDTLYGISNQFGVSVEDIKSTNNLSSNNISIGQVLKIPNNSGTNPQNTITYTVKKGDSLYNIARVYKTTTADLIKLNNLKSNLLSIGQTLLIPETYFDNTDMIVPLYTNYTVKKGDSLYSIAKKYNLAVNTIIEDNALKSNLLNIGQNLKIRTNEDYVVEECFGEEYTSPSMEYVVKKGDTLYSIAKKYNKSLNEIKKNNNLNSNSLTIGQVLKI